MTTVVCAPAKPSHRHDGEQLPCSARGCPNDPVVATRFKNHLGHVHECLFHSAESAEWLDVAEKAPLPCPWSHGSGRTWVGPVPML